MCWYKCLYHVKSVVYPSSCEVSCVPLIILQMFVSCQVSCVPLILQMFVSCQVSCVPFIILQMFVTCQVSCVPLIILQTIVPTYYAYNDNKIVIYTPTLYNYLCNQCLSPLTLWIRILDTTLCDKVLQLLATGWWLSLSTLASSTNKADHHDITEILLKVALKTITLSPPPYS